MFEISMNSRQVNNAIQSSKKTYEEVKMNAFSSAIQTFRSLEKKNEERERFIIRFFALDTEEKPLTAFQESVKSKMDETSKIKEGVIVALASEMLAWNKFIMVSEAIKKITLIDTLLSVAKARVKGEEKELKNVVLEKEDHEVFLEMLKRVEKSTVSKLEKALEKPKKVKEAKPNNSYALAFLESINSKEEESTEEIEEESTEEIEEVQAPKGRKKTTV
jgi:hypothetical protein